MNIPAELRIPSPIQHLDIAAARSAKVELFIKRDDLIHPFVSGNKWRKLEGFVREANIAGAEELVSFGGAYSNHLLALAAAGAMLHLPTLGYVRGEQPAEEGHILRLCRALGMQLVYLPREEFAGMKREKMGYIPAEKAFYIPEGGYGRPGLEGLKAVREELGFDPDHIVTAVGTGTTLAGISAAYANTSTTTEGIVVLKGMEAMEQEVQNLLAGLPQGKYVLHHRFHEGGYAKQGEKLREFMTGFTRESGILTDPIYTGKMMLAVHTLLQEGHFPAGSTVVCLHTGGIIGGLSLL